MTSMGHDRCFQLRDAESCTSMVCRACNLQIGKTSTSVNSCYVTAGASGGAAAAHLPIAPQFIPVSQLVLMTIKVVQELKAE